MTARVLFVLRMARRELRASWFRLLFFFLCVALGVAAIVVLRSVVQNVKTTLMREARSLVGADLVVQSTAAWTDRALRALEGVLDAAGAHTTTDVIETQTMASVPGPTGAVRLVEVRAVEDGFPYYGAIDLAGRAIYSHDLLRDRGVLVEPELAAQFGLHIGDALRLAGQPFVVRGVVTKDRVQRAGGFAFGPRVYVDVGDLQALGVLGFGSRATYERFVRIDARAIGPTTDRLHDAFGQGSVTVRSWQGVEDRLGRNLTIAENYLGLVGFAVVVLGGIGVWSVARVFVAQRITSVAVLRSVGATSGLVLATYLVQVAWLALGGSVGGIALAATVLAAIPARVLTPIGLSSARITLSAASQGAAVGLLVSLLFALMPLLEVRHIKPLLLLRADTAPTARRRDWQSLVAGGATIAALVLVASWQAESLRAGVYVSAGMAIVGAALSVVARVLVRAVQPLTRSKRFAVRHAVIGLGRPGNQTRVIVMTVGLGCFFVFGVRAVESNLLREFTLQIGSHAPDLILIDVQRDQTAGVQTTVAPYLRAPASFMPLMRGRVVAVIGRRVQLPTPDAVKTQGALTREYGMTFRPALEDNERLTAGAFWTGALTDPHTADGLDTEVSIAQLVHDQADVDVGDIMSFGVGGRIIRARVTSIRDVTWDEAQNGGFVFVLRPGPAVEHAPHTFVAFLQLWSGSAVAGNLERDLVRAFPNVSAIDVRDVLASLEEVLANATLGVTIVGAVTVVGGVLILIGAVAMTRFQRLYDAAVYRTLGASTRRLAGMVALEYGLLGSLAGAVGALGALGLSWAAAREVFDIDWHPEPLQLLMGVGVAALAVCAIGLAASADVLVRKPMATLRGE